ncbi:acyl-CoA dehydrogenase family protein [Mycobacterium sp. CVI_P3]|uniref:Acyl-CoA dehydrogenase family protein n=1 Tax=Mycobacterium pinniadriaticum TaxID=2994102 RepID=A0ABT3SF81_9MYCO|nr:acyl-CoA dehydrogenase family protein [Mycobacterium pinniadriaticum]MCX2931746.1 acyl-CoA dehydrogenase family protein [Mycobacterium pinniadriaticum]MCX2938179.1 acyl-CoA dehydrogenase family protein [Mycobacterium pinniadriaticum]
MSAQTDGQSAALPTDVGEFQSRARQFIESTLPTLLPIPDTAPDHRERVSLFTSRAAELAAVPTARQWRAAKFDAGFGWLTGPREYGGAGLPEEYEHHYLDVELDYEVPPEDCFSTGLEGLGQTILSHGSDDLKELLLRKIFRGDLITCLLFSEPGAGSDLGSVRTRAVHDGDVWVVNGQKVWSSRTHYADVGLLLARTGTEGERHRGITTFLVDIASPGLQVRPLVEMTGDAGFNEVFFDGVRIPDDRRLGEVGAGWSIYLAIMAASRDALARSRRRGRRGGLASVGSAERVAGVLRRVGKTDDPKLRQDWARLYTAYKLNELTSERLAGQWSEPRIGAARAMGKLALSNAMSAAADLVARTLGPRILADTGEVDSFDWLPYLLETPAFHIGGGTDQIMRNLVAERGLGLPR